MTDQAERIAQPVRKGRPSATERRERMNAVLDAARAEFVRKGYRLATMDAIAARAGVSKRSIYKWHTDKAALFRACVMDTARQLPVPAVDMELPLEATLVQFGTAVLRALSTEFGFGMGSLIMWEGKDFPEIPLAIDQAEGLITEPVSKILETHGIRSEPAKRLAYLFFVLLCSDIQRRMMLGLAPPSDQEIRRDANDAAILLLRGLADWTDESEFKSGRIT